MANKKFTGNRKRRSNTKSGTRGDIKRMVRSMIESSRELKYLNGAVAATLSATPTVFPVTQTIIQDATGTGRNGDDIILKKLIIKLRADMNQGNTVLSNAWRFILFADMQGDGANPVAADILSGTTVTSLYGLEVVKEKRFKIYYDHVYELSLNGQAGMTIEKTFNLNHPVYYEDTTNVATASGKGALYLILYDNLAANHIGVNATIHMRFTDS
jgi:hypothetical protein